MNTRTLLLCPPVNFGVDYAINPWMHPDQDPVDHRKAVEQWTGLVSTYKELGWDVDAIPPAEGLPDQVFLTDSAIIFGGVALLSRFRYEERRRESARTGEWLQAKGVPTRPARHYLEGGDVLSLGERILAGHGFRSDPQAAREMSSYFGREVVSLKLVNERFYHLDTALAVLREDTAAAYLPAFDEASQQQLRRLIPNLIEASLSEASSFGLNAVSNGKQVVTGNGSLSLIEKFRDRGLDVRGLDVSEYKKSGGGINCMTLQLRR